MSLSFADYFILTCFLLLVYHKYDPNFIAASLDEAYLDITQICKERGVSGEEVGAYSLLTVLVISVLFSYILKEFVCI